MLGGCGQWTCHSQRCVATNILNFTQWIVTTVDDLLPLVPNSSMPGGCGQWTCHSQRCIALQPTFLISMISLNGLLQLFMTCYPWYLPQCQGVVDMSLSGMRYNQINGLLTRIANKINKHHRHSLQIDYVISSHVEMCEIPWLTMLELMGRHCSKISLGFKQVWPIPPQ